MFFVSLTLSSLNSQFSLLFLNSGVLWMENTNKLWELPLNAGDWINLRKQLQEVTICKELYHTAFMSLIPL